MIQIIMDLDERAFNLNYEGCEKKMFLTFWDFQLGFEKEKKRMNRKEN